MPIRNIEIIDITIFCLLPVSGRTYSTIFRKLIFWLLFRFNIPVVVFILDEPFGGVDPATRDYILDTILSNFNENASVIISTHLISDIERILDEVIFIDKGRVILHEDADKLRNKEKSSIDEVFRRMFKC